MAVPDKNLKLDAKKRITLGKLAPDDVSSYDVEVKENGVIILYPKVEIPAQEVWLFKNTQAIESVKKGLEDSAAGRVKKRESFAKYAEDDIE